MRAPKKAFSILLITTLIGSGAVPVYAEDDVVPAEPVEETVLPEVATSTPEVTTGPAVPEEATSTEPTVSTETEEILVKYKERRLDLDTTEGQEQAEELVEDEGLSVEEHIEGANISVVEAVDAEEAIERLEDNPLVEYAEPNYSRGFLAIDTNDTDRALLWALENTGQTVGSITGTADADIDGKEAWSLSLGTSTVVAVIDNGVLLTHPDLENNLWDGSTCVSDTGAALGSCEHGYDFADDDTSPMPELPFPDQGEHGTHVAGIIAAERNNGQGVIGVAPSAKIMALRFALDVASEVRAIDFARENGAKIINASFGGYTESEAEYDAIERFRDAGGIFVAAAANGGDDQEGDDNDTTPVYPASYDLTNIISVAATDQFDVLTDFSNYGDETVDLGAPGRNIHSTATSNGTNATYTRLSGTSMAAPQVAGAAALIRAVYPDASIGVVKNALLSSGDSLETLSGKTVSGKRLNARAALALLAGDSEPPVITLNGSATVTVAQRSEYTELGATATDNVDGSVDVLRSGDTVDTSTAGTYTVRYNATDSVGNPAVEVIRTVTVTAVESERRRSGGGGGGGGGSRNKVEENPSRTLFTTPYDSMTPEQRAALLQTLLTLLAQLQAQLAALKAQGL